jgi:predicted methyltransferase
MSHRFRNFSAFITGALLLASGAYAGPIPTSSDTTTLLKEAVNGSWRSPANKARDQYRHPVETLEFFGIRPDMTVIELSPGGGWYTEILAPFLYDEGHLIEASSPKAASFDAKLKADPAVYGHIEKLIPFAPPKQVNLGAEDSADMVLTFRNAHDWMNNSPETLAAVFKAAYAVLKPGGVFGVVEHRANASTDAAQSAMALHRLPEDYVIKLGLATGFKLAGRSEINANPKDHHDINVHRLPPDLAGGDSERAQMQAIGESDRMTLKFVKPKQ